MPKYIYLFTNCLYSPALTITLKEELDENFRDVKEVQKKLLGYMSGCSFFSPSNDLSNVTNPDVSLIRIVMAVT